MIETGCSKADKIFYGDLKHGRAYTFNLGASVNDSKSRIGIANFTVKYSEKMDFNGSKSFPTFLWKKQFKESGYKLEKKSFLSYIIPRGEDIPIIRADKSYNVNYRPNYLAKEKVDGDLIIAYGLTYYKENNTTGKWIGPYETISSCKVYRIVDWKE